MVGNLEYVNAYAYIGEEIEMFLDAKKKKSLETYKAYRNSLIQVFNDWFGVKEFKFITKNQLEQVTLRNMVEYFDTLSNELNEYEGKKFSNSTLNARITTVKELYKYLSAWDYIDYPTDKLSQLEMFPDEQKEIEMIPFELAMKYIEAAKKHKKGLEKSLIMELAIETALRAEELLELEWGNFIVEEDGVIIKSFGNNKGKGNKEFIDKISHEFYNKLLQLKEIKNDNKLFSLNYRQLVYMMDKLGEELNDTEFKYTFHSFKKLAVTMCYLNNNNCIDTARKKARHSNVNTTMKYLRLTNLSIKGAISAKMNVEEDLFKTISHELLLEIISEMSPEVKLVLNNKIKQKLS